MGALVAFPADRWQAPVPEAVPAPPAAAVVATAPAEPARHYTRDETIALIRAALKARSGRPWSVTGGRGTAWGWIKIDAPPARCTWRHVLKPDAVSDCGTENYDDVDSGRPGGHMSPTDTATLAQLLDLEQRRVYDGVSVPASSAYYREYIERAQGNPVTAAAVPYWD